MLVSSDKGQNAYCSFAAKKKEDCPAKDAPCCKEGARKVNVLQKLHANTRNQAYESFSQARM